jgi:hypothetical protein
MRRLKMSKVANRKGSVTDTMVIDKIINILVLLERKTRRMKKRLKRIETRVVELRKKESRDTEKKTEGPTRAGMGAFRCSVGKSLLMLRILGMLSRAATLEMGSIEEDKQQLGKVRRKKHG